MQLAAHEVHPEEVVQGGLHHRVAQGVVPGVPSLGHQLDVVGPHGHDEHVRPVGPRVVLPDPGHLLEHVALLGEVHHPRPARVAAALEVLPQELLQGAPPRVLDAHVQPVGDRVAHERHAQEARVARAGRRVPVAVPVARVIDALGDPRVAAPAVLGGHDPPAEALAVDRGDAPPVAAQVAQPELRRQEPQRHQQHDRPRSDLRSHGMEYRRGPRAPARREKDGNPVPVLRERSEGRDPGPREGGPVRVHPGCRFSWRGAQR